MSIVDEIATELRINKKIIESQLFASKKQVKKIKIPKKNGAHRSIYVAPKSYKIFQYYILNKYIKYVKKSHAASAFWKGSSILKNAKKHRERTYLVRIDISNFFPSIHINDFVSVLDDSESHIIDLFSNPENAEVIRETCFSEEGYVRAGYPISPFIADITMRGIDQEITKYLEDKFQEGTFSYSRYADDLVIGFDEKCGKEVQIAVSEIIEKRDYPKLSINHSKTRYFNRNVGNAIVTGVRICQDGRLTLPKSFKDDLRFKLSLLKKGKLATEELSSLEGCLNHCRDIDPSFYTKLQTRYFKSIAELKNRNKS